MSNKIDAQVPNQLPLPQLEGNIAMRDWSVPRNYEPIIEEPATPEPECFETFEYDIEDIGDIEDAFRDDPDEIPTININMEEFRQNLQNYIREMNSRLEEGDMSKALIPVTPEAASIPVPKLKNVCRLRTTHQVFVSLLFLLIFLTSYIYSLKN